MIACLDVHYSESIARAAAVVFDDWLSTDSLATYATNFAQPNQYTPGSFYLRELGPLLAVVKQIREPIHTWIVDGYCYLSSSGEPGLGAHLQSAIGRQVDTFIGVAKNRYRGSSHAVEVRRATSQRPLFVTAIGIGCGLAAAHVASMAGEFRIPKMLKEVDQLSRAPAAN